MRILHVVAGNLYGGVEAMLVTIARHAASDPSSTHHFACCFEGRLSSELERLGCGYHRLGVARLSRPWTVWSSRRRLRALVSRLCPDVVVCHGAWVHAAFAPRVLSAGTPCVLFVHDLPSAHWLERLARRTPPSALLANSRFTLGRATPLFHDVPAAVYHCPVAAPALPANGRAQARAELGLDDARVVFVQASRMQSWKGQLGHLRVLAALQRDERWVSLQIGAPQRPSERSYYELLQQAAHELGIEARVKFLGQRSDVPQLLAAADVHFQPNEAPEPFGVAFVEAMLAGLPILTYAAGAIPEVVGTESGILATSEAELIQGAQRLIDAPDLRRSLGERGHARARQLFSPELQVPRLAELLSELVRISPSSSRMR